MMVVALHPTDDEIVLILITVTVNIKLLCLSQYHLAAVDQISP